MESSRTAARDRVDEILAGVRPSANGLKHDVAPIPLRSSRTSYPVSREPREQVLMLEQVFNRPVVTSYTSVRIFRRAGLLQHAWHASGR